MKKFFAAGLMLLSVAALTVSAATVAGTTTGVFSGATGPSGFDSTISGGGSSFTWGCTNALNCFFNSTSGGSNLTFTGGNINGTTDFIDTTAGVLTFTNNVIQNNSGATGVNLAITMAFTLPAGGPSQVFTYNLGIQNTTNPQGDTIVLLPNSFTAHTFTVAGITYSVNLLGFFNGAGTQLSSLFAAEGATTTATLRASVSATSVPEPTSIILLGSVVSGLAFAFRKKLAK